MTGCAYKHLVLLSVSSVPASIHFGANKHFVGPRKCALQNFSSVFIPLRRLVALIHAERYTSAIIRQYLTFRKLSSLKLLAGEENCL